MVHKIKSGLFLAILFLLTGCQADISSIPDRPVHVERNILTYSLKSQGSYLYLTSSNADLESTGFGGILIVHAFDDNYYAFDLACPVEVDRSIRVGKPDLSLMCECGTCGEKYNVYTGGGYPTKKIAKEGLRRYTVRLDSDNNNLLVTR